MRVGRRVQSNQQAKGEKQHRKQACIAVGSEDVHQPFVIVRIKASELPGKVPAHRPGRGEREGELQGVAVGKDRKKDREPHQHDGRHQEAAQPFGRVVRKKPRGGFDANQGVVLGILVGVDCVIEQCPGDTCEIEQDRRPIKAAGVGGPCQQRAPVIGDAKERLRPPCEAFCKRVDRDRGKGGDPHEYGGRGEGQQDRERDEGLDDHPCGRTFKRDLARRDRAGFGARDRGVDFTVGDIIPCAACAAHQKRADGAAQPDPRVIECGGAGVQDRQHQPPPARQQQKPCTDGPIRATEAQIRARPDRGQRGDPIALDGVRHLTLIRAVLLWSLTRVGHKVRPMASIVRLYVDHALGEGQTVPLNRDHAHYLFGVMRLGVGAVVQLFNGVAGEYTAEVLQAGKRGGVLVCRKQTKPLQMPPDLWLLFAPIKKARTDFIVEKAAEMGASRICPVQTAFTNSERVRQDRLQAHAIEAAEQCGGTFVPEVADLRRLGAVLDHWPEGRRLMFCDEEQAGERLVLQGDPGPWAILIGPEGGFSPDERARLAALPFATTISLGPRILRADTAAVAALTLWQAALGDWR